MSTTSYLGFFNTGLSLYLTTKVSILHYNYKTMSVKLYKYFSSNLNVSHHHMDDWVSCSYIC